MELFGWEWLFLDRQWLASASNPSHPAKHKNKVICIHWGSTVDSVIVTPSPEERKFIAEIICYRV